MLPTEEFAQPITIRWLELFLGFDIPYHALLQSHPLDFKLVMEDASLKYGEMRLISPPLNECLPK